MNNRHRRTLEAVFAMPTPTNLIWSDVEALLIAAGATRYEGQGSRVRFYCNGETETFHRPHPHKEAKRYQVRLVRAYLERIGVTP